ncbi:MAG: alpha/beta fold hydrolase [Pseudomonadota bacterium]
MIEPDRIIAWLAETAGPRPATASPLGRSYSRFYSLEFPSTAHEMGLVQAGNFQVFVQKFSRHGERHGTVLMLHGYLDHSGLQAPSISRLLDLGFDVVALDHPGHGLSSGDRASIPGFQAYVDSLAAAIGHFPDVQTPLTVMGHSMGGAIAMTYLLQHPGVFERAVLIAPLFRPKSWRLLRTVHVFGRRLIRGQRRLFRDNTRDEEYRQFIREKDPLSPRFIPTEWVTAMFAWVRDFHQLAPVATRVLVVQGTDDGTVDWRGNIVMIRKKFPGASIHIVNEGKHQLLNEIDEWRHRTWEPIEPFLLEH